MPRIGLLSDSHGDAYITSRAVEALITAGVDMLLHMGDICSDAVLQALLIGLDGSGNPKPIIRIVFGNCDRDICGLTHLAGHLGIAVDDPIGTLDFDGRSLVYQHGHNGYAMNHTVDDIAPDYLCHGHTHKQRDIRIGRTRIICPGALHRVAKYSVAILDTDRDHLQFIPISHP